MKRQIEWDLDLLPSEYPSQIKNIYYKNYSSERIGFSNWIDDLSKDYKYDIDWWLLFPSSRNPNYSKLFHYICILETFKKINKSEISLQITTSSEFLFNLIKKESFNKRKVDLVKKRNEKRTFYIDYLKSFLFQFYLFFFVRLFIKKKRIKEKIFIHTYPNNKLEKVERLFQFKDKKHSNNYVLVPSFLISKNLLFWSKLIIKISKNNYVFKEHHIKLFDLIYAFKFIFRLKKFKKRYKKYKNLDFSSLIYSEINNLKNFNTYIIGLLNYKFVENLKEKEVKIKKSICWYENHELKGWNMGFRKFFPKVKTLGYQGFSPLLPLMNSFPTKNEEKFKVIPEKIIVTSPKYKQVINEFNKKLNCINSVEDLDLIDKDVNNMLWRVVPQIAMKKFGVKTFKNFNPCHKTEKTFVFINPIHASIADNLKSELNDFLTVSEEIEITLTEKVVSTLYGGYSWYLAYLKSCE